MRIVLGFLLLFPFIASAETLELDDALRATYSACVGIDENLSDLKKMAGINTVVTAVGTGLGAGALTVGIIASRIKSRIGKITHGRNVR